MNGPLVIGGATLHQGDCLRVLKTMPDRSVQCCVTSPPYFGLRSYMDAAHPDKAAEIGTEQTPDEYVAKLVAVFAEVRRVLKDDGVCWVNLGDSYAGGGTIGRNDAGRDIGGGGNTLGSGNPGPQGQRKPVASLKPKDLIGIPWMLAFALRADGWYLRQDIIWAKPNPMPESVKDRCTKSHEYIFLLSKSQKYYYDSEAISEPSVWAGDPRAGYGRLHYRGKREGQEGTGQENFVSITETRNKRSVWTITTKPYKGAHFATFNPELIKPCILAGCPEGGIVFDPFVGSGTTVATAIQLGRKGIGIDLSLKYLHENAQVRIAEAQQQPRLLTPDNL